MIKKILKAKFVIILGFPFLILLFIIFLVLLVCNVSVGSNEMVKPNTFYVPFSDEVNYSISSEFGYRTNPLTNEETKLHTGIDLVAPEGTDILASCDGYVIKTGYAPENFGNYVYIEHNIDGKIYYTAYGHMANDSIVVSVGQQVHAKDKIGVIGATGKVTGTHLHFSIMTPNPKLTKENLVNPRELLTNLK